MTRTIKSSIYESDEISLAAFPESRNQMVAIAAVDEDGSTTIYLSAEDARRLAEVLTKAADIATGA